MLKTKVCQRTFTCGVLLFSLLGCNRTPSESIKIEANNPVEAATTGNLFSPFEYKKLLSDPESYGVPKNTGSEGVESDRIRWREYVATHGRLRVYEETRNEGEHGWHTGNWINIYPGKLYLENVVSAKYLKNVKPKKGNWTLYIMNGEEPTWFLTLTLTDTAITEIYYSEREYL